MACVNDRLEASARWPVWTRRDPLASGAVVRSLRRRSGSKASHESPTQHSLIQTVGGVSVELRTGRNRRSGSDSDALSRIEIVAGDLPYGAMCIPDAVGVAPNGFSPPTLSPRTPEPTERSAQGLSCSSHAPPGAAPPIDQARRAQELVKPDKRSWGHQPEHPSTTYQPAYLLTTQIQRNARRRDR